MTKNSSEKLRPGLMYVFRAQNDEMLRRTNAKRRPIFFKNHIDIQPESYNVEDINRAFEHLHASPFELWELLDLMVVLQDGYNGYEYCESMESYDAKAEFYYHYELLLRGLSEIALRSIEHRLEDLDVVRHRSKADRFVRQFRSDRAALLNSLPENEAHSDSELEQILRGAGIDWA